MRSDEFKRLHEQAPWYVNSPDDAVFISWRRDCEALIKKVYGPTSTEFEDFRNLQFEWRSVTAALHGQDVQALFRNAIDRAQAYLDSFFREQLREEADAHLDSEKTLARQKSDTLKPATHSKVDNRKQVFISYSHKDKAFLDALLIHLRPLQKSGLIDSWSDQRIKAGSLWKQDIEVALANSHVAILLVSPDFLASDFIVENELTPLLSRAKDAGVKIIPVILRACRFTRDASLGIFQAINDPNKPIASLPAWEQDSLYDRIAIEIENLSK